MCISFAVELFVTKNILLIRSHKEIIWRKIMILTLMTD